MAFTFVCSITTPSSVVLQGRKETIQHYKLQDEEHHQQLLFLPPILFVHVGGKEEVGVMCHKITIVELNKRLLNEQANTTNLSPCFF
jgi:hypothetical protein